MPRPILAVLSLAFLTALVFACGSGGRNATSSPTVPASPADAAAIRQVDFTKASEVQTMLRQLGSASVDAPAIVYADLTGDGRDEAIVPLSSGGTLGNLAYLVFTMRSGSPQLILTRTRDRSSAGGLRMAVVDGKLVETAGQYGPEDPLCCPGVLRKTYFRWDGSRLQVEREESQPGSTQPKQ